MWCVISPVFFCVASPERRRQPSLYVSLSTFGGGGSCSVECRAGMVVAVVRARPEAAV